MLSACELDMVEREIATKRFWPGFEPELEEMYFAQLAVSERAKVVPVSIVGWFLFAPFWFFDLFAVPDVPTLSIVLRLGFAVPLAAFCCIYLRWTTALVRDATLTVAAFVTLLIEAVLMLSSAAPLRSAMLMGLPMLILFMLSFQMLTFRAALMVAAATMPLVIYAVHCIHELPQQILVCIDMIYVCMLVTMINMARYMEDERRKSFLLRMRSDLQKKQIELNAEIDPLTRLHNRNALATHMPMVFARARQSSKYVAVVALDIDYFKSYNDIYGHPAGDVCIATVANRAAAAIGSAGLGIRMGGEEMLFLLSDCDLADAKAHAERICAAIRAAALPHAGNQPWGVVTASVGCASTIPATGDACAEFAALLEAADAALYLAKRSGRNTVRPASSAFPALNHSEESGDDDGVAIRFPVRAQQR